MQPGQLVQTLSAGSYVSHLLRVAKCLFDNPDLVVILLHAQQSKFCI